MTNNQDIQFRTRDEVISDLITLIKQPGYIYSLCLILFEDFHMSLEKLGTINYRERLSVKEAAFILGYLTQNKIDCTYPESVESLIQNKELTYKLLRELHNTFLYPQREMIQDMFSNQQMGICSEPTFSKFEFFTKDGSMQEAIFYSGDGVYDFQYLEYLPLKYRYDEDWLEKNRGYVFKQVISITQSIKRIQQEKANNVGLIDLRDYELQKKLKKDIKGKDKDKKLEEILTRMEFMQFYSLFPPVPDDSKLSVSEKEELWRSFWNVFYDNLLDLFILDSDCLSKKEGIDNYLLNFGLGGKGENENYKTIGDFNIINSKPIIKLSNGKWFLPVFYLLAEAVYESPYYWMCEDDEYKSKALHNRGKVGEEIVCDLLRPVFGPNHVFPSVKIKKTKEKTVTDIDVLCLLGNKALCVQVKSKKMTIAARRGEVNALVRDFKGAFQNAYEQGLMCRDYLKSKECIFLDENGNKLTIPEYINDVYILCVTTENYPAIPYCSFVLLDQKETNPNPLFLSVFDLELLAHYLNKPYDFLYYIKQRTILMDYFWADEEIIFLGYHLLHKLWRDPKYDRISLDTDFGSAIDRNYYPYKLGLLDKLSVETDGIANAWHNDEFEQLCNELIFQNVPGAIDIIFVLLDLDGKSRDNLLKYIKLTKQKTQEDGGVHSFTMPANRQLGISFVSINTMSKDDLETQTSVYAHIRKYINRADSWLGLGSYPSSSRIIDCFYYDVSPWEHNEEDEQACADFRNRHNTKFLSINRHKKIGRNDPCPCGSGLKYKKCCGR